MISKIPLIVNGIYIWYILNVYNYRLVYQIRIEYVLGMNIIFDWELDIQSDSAKKFGIIIIERKCMKLLLKKVR